MNIFYGNASSLEKMGVPNPVTCRKKKRISRLRVDVRQQAIASLQDPIQTSPELSVSYAIK